MNRGLWLARKNYLFTLIKKVSDGWGGDSSDDLTKHCQQVLDMYPGDAIEEAILCYQEMVAQLNVLGCFND